MFPPKSQSSPPPFAGKPSPLPAPVAEGPPAHGRKQHPPLYFRPTSIRDAPSIMAAARPWEPKASRAVSMSRTS